MKKSTIIILYIALSEVEQWVCIWNAAKRWTDYPRNLVYNW